MINTVYRSLNRFLLLRFEGLSQSNRKELDGKRSKKKLCMRFMVNNSNSCAKSSL